MSENKKKSIFDFNVHIAPSWKQVIAAVLMVLSGSIFFSILNNPMVTDLDYGNVPEKVYALLVFLTLGAGFSFVWKLGWLREDKGLAKLFASATLEIWLLALLMAFSALNNGDIFPQASEGVPVLPIYLLIATDMVGFLVEFWKG